VRFKIDSELSKYRPMITYTSVRSDSDIAAAAAAADDNDDDDADDDVDVNECETKAARCQHGCVNTVGSFQCTCPPGYRLSSNRRTCQGQSRSC